MGRALSPSCRVLPIMADPKPRPHHPEPAPPPRPWRRTARVVCAIVLVLFALWMVSTYLVVLGWTFIIALTA